jgi:FAD/FMN-containing dehydrogenase
VSILTPAAPRAVNNVILALPTFENVLPLFKLARRHLSEILSAFEFIDRTAYNLAVKHGQGKGLSDEEIEGAECFVLLETSGGEKEHDEEVRIPSVDAEALINVFVRKKLTVLLETLLEAEQPLITTGVLSQSPGQFNSLWKLREGVPEAVSKEGRTYKYDISVPIASFKEVVDATREQLRKKGLLHEDAVRHVIGYGHVGDGKLQHTPTLMLTVSIRLTGNLHLNIAAAAYSQEIESALEPFVYELVGESLKPAIVIYVHKLMWFASLLQGVDFCRAWHWLHENPRNALFETCCCHRYNEKDKASF